MDLINNKSAEGKTIVIKRDANLITSLYDFKRDIELWAWENDIDLLWQGHCTREGLHTKTVEIEYYIDDDAMRTLFALKWT